MNQRERKREEQEIADAVKVLRATLRSIAHRKALRYEQNFLGRVRDMIDQEISCNAEVSEASAEFLAREVKNEVQKP